MSFVIHRINKELKPEVQMVFSGVELWLLGTTTTVYQYFCATLGVKHMHKKTSVRSTAKYLHQAQDTADVKISFCVETTMVTNFKRKKSLIPIKRIRLDIIVYWSQQQHGNS